MAVKFNVLGAVWRGSAACGLACGLAACVGPGVVFDGETPGPVWPPSASGEPARVRYVGRLHGEFDLKPGLSLGEVVLGKTYSVMVNPIAVCTDGRPDDERVFVADSFGKAVYVLDLRDRTWKEWRPPGERGGFETPVAVTWDAPTSRLLVSDSSAGEVEVFDGSGAWTGSIGKGVLKRPCGLVVERSTGNLLVADAASHQVVVLDSAGSVVKRIGERGAGPGQFNYPTNVALDRAGYLYVADSLNFRVQVLGPAPAYEPVRQIGSKGDMPGYFSQPKGVALDPEGHLYVVDANFEAVQVFDTDGRLLMSFGHEGAGIGEFWLPAGMFIDPQGRIWIADTHNSRVQVFDYLPEAKKP